MYAIKSQSIFHGETKKEAENIVSLWKALRGEEKLTGRHLLMLASIVIFFFVGTAWTVGHTSKSEFCAACHEMGTMHQTWLTSSHKNVACIDCHSEPGVKGMVKAKIKGVKELYVHVSGASIAPQAQARDINCLSCHQEKVTTNVEKAAAAKNPHTIKHFSNGMTCISCHGGLVHNDKMNTSSPSREACISCHLNQMDKDPTAYSQEGISWNVHAGSF
jgi:trimethylamine-N-oxide reductase cytochrome c-type subunit TorC